MLVRAPVSYALAIGAYTTQMMMTIVLLGGDYSAFALDSNNRLVAEAIGIGLAIAAALFLEWWVSQRSSCRVRRWYARDVDVNWMGTPGSARAVASPSEPGARHAARPSTAMRASASTAARL